MSTPIFVQVEHLPPEMLPEISRWLKSELDTAFNDRAKLEKKWAQWLKQYDGRLERNDNPAAWQSRLDFATTRTHIQHVAARLVNPFFNQERILAVKPRVPEYDELATKLEALLDFLFDSFPAQQHLTDSVQDALIFGFAASKILYIDRRAVVTDWVLDTATGQMVERPMTVPDGTGAIPQRIYPSDMIWPAYARDQRTTPWIGDRFYLTYDDIQERIDDPSTGWYNVIDRLGCTRGVDPVTKTREALSGVRPTEDRYEFVEVYVNRFPSKLGLPKGLRAIITINRESGEIVRAIRNYYHRYQDPYVLLYWDKLPNSMDANSLCYYLEPYHRAISATVCMELDAGSLAIKGRFPYTSDQQIAEQLKSQSRAMGDIVQGTTPAGEAIQVIELYREPPNTLARLRQEIKLEAERVANLNPYNRGEEQAQRPTASGQTLLVEQGLEPIKQRLEQVRAWVVQLGLVMLARVKQFHQNFVEFGKYIGNDFVQISLTLPPGSIENRVLVETVASSSNMSESYRQQQMIGLVDRMTQAYNIMAQLAQQAEQAAMSGSPMGMIYAGFVQGYWFLIDRLLTEFKVPHRDVINPPINALEAMGMQYAMQIQALQQQLAMMSQSMGMAGGGAPPQIPPGAPMTQGEVANATAPGQPPSY